MADAAGSGDGDSRKSPQIPEANLHDDGPAGAKIKRAVGVEPEQERQQEQVRQLEQLTEKLRLEARSPETEKVIRMLTMSSREDLVTYRTGEGLMMEQRTESFVSETTTLEPLRSSSTSALLEGVILREQPTPLSSQASATAAGTGRLDNLTEEQREKLFQLWGMLFSTFSTPYDGTPSKKQRGDDARSLLETTQRVAHELMTDVAFTEEESSAWADNPMVDELFSQCSTDDPDRTLLRFLRARKWVVPDAYNMLTDSLKWRHNVGLRQLMAEGEGRLKTSLLEGGKNFFWKTDKRGNLMCYIRSRLHDKAAQTLQESIDFTIYTVEWGRRLRKDDEQLVSILFDLRDAPFASLDIGILQFMVNALQSFYPEILGQCLIKDAPWIFNGFWTLVRPLLDPVVANKIVFVKQANLPNYIDRACIPAEYGGDDPFFYRYIPPPEGEGRRGRKIVSTTVAATVVADALLPPTASSPLSSREGQAGGEKEEGQEEEEMAQLALARIEVLKARFVEATREMLVLIARVADPRQLETLLIPVRERRDEIKRQLCECYRQVDCAVIPPTLYHRLGILDAENRVDWSRYGVPLAPEVRMSAPPILSPHTQQY